MNRDEALKLLRAHKATLVQRFGVVDLALFGSIVRDQATDDSDVDILVRFDSPATSKRYFGVQFYIEDLLGRPVDLVGFGHGQSAAGGDASIYRTGDGQCLIFT